MVLTAVKVIVASLPQAKTMAPPPRALTLLRATSKAASSQGGWTTIWIVSGIGRAGQWRAPVQTLQHRIKRHEGGES